MDTDRSPGVGPLMWATLRLLAFSWLVLSGVTVWQFIRFPPGWTDLPGIVVVWLFLAGPHLMFGAAAWRSRGRPKVIAPALIGAILYAVMASVTGAVVVLDPPAGRAMNEFGRIAFCMYSLGWLVGIVALGATFDRSLPPTPPVNNGD